MECFSKLRVKKVTIQGSKTTMVLLLLYRETGNAAAI
jgi:hypothetical protein